MSTDIEVVVDPAQISTAVTVEASAPVASVVLATGAPGPAGANGSDASVTSTNITTALGYTPADAANPSNPFDQSLNTTDSPSFSGLTWGHTAFGLDGNQNYSSSLNSDGTISMWDPHFGGPQFVNISAQTFYTPENGYSNAGFYPTLAINGSYLANQQWVIDWMGKNISGYIHSGDGVSNLTNDAGYFNDASAFDAAGAASTALATATTRAIAFSIAL